jgi:hypothetical protein
MNNITDELAKLHELTGAEFSRQVERIALRNEFYPIEGETDIYITGGVIQVKRVSVENHDFIKKFILFYHK